MNVLEAISCFQLEFLPPEWVDGVWNDFSEIKDIPEEFELQVSCKNYYKLIQKLIDAIQNWLVDDDDIIPCPSTSKSPPPVVMKKCWNVLSNYVDHKALVCFLSTFFKTELSKLEVVSTRRLAFIAGRLYLNLLSVPGAYMFNIFNPVLFNHSLSIFRLGNLLRTSIEFCRNGRGGQNEDNEQETNKDHSLVTLTKLEKHELLKEMCLLLGDLSTCLKIFHLNEELDVLNNIVKVLIDLTQLERQTNVFEDTITQVNSAAYVALHSYQIIQELCIPQNGDVCKIVSIIMNNFLETFLINGGDIKMSKCEAIVARMDTFTFINKLLLSLGSNAEPGVKAFVQQMCVRLPEKAENRGKIVPDIVRLLKGFPDRIFKDIVVWIVSLAYTDSVQYRINAVEIISKLLDIKERSENGLINQLNEVSMNQCLKKFMIAAIISKCLDISPTVRGKALMILANIISCNHTHNKEIINDLFYNSENDGLHEGQEKKVFDFVAHFNKEENELLPSEPLPSGIYLLRIVSKLTKDKKVFVRKSALHLMFNACILYEKLLTQDRLQILCSSCRDRSLEVRKLSSKCLTELLLKYPDNIKISEAWVEGVVSLIPDNEIKCQETVIEYFKNVIIDNIAPYNKSLNARTKLPWLVLREISSKGKRSLFRFVCKIWATQGTIKKPFCATLLSHIGTENNLAVWFFIVTLSEFQDFPFPDVISHYFLEKIHSAHNADEYLSQLALEALYLNLKGLKKVVQDELYVILHYSLEQFSVPLSLIARYLDICCKLRKSETLKWCGKLIKLCEEYLRGNVAPGCKRTINDETLSLYVYTLGDATHYHPGVNSDVIKIIANLIMPGFIKGGNVGAWRKYVSEKTRATAVVTLGKICLQDQSLARTFVPVLVRTLNNQSSQEAVKINSMIALTDLCIRYATLVEGYLGAICMTLKDSNVNVRENTLTFLMQLIQEDYIKLKIPYIFYLFMMILDSSSGIRNLTQAFIVNYALAKFPNIMSQHFTRAIFFFNDYEVKYGCSKKNLTEMEVTVLSLAGESNSESRKTIYKFMLSHMKNDHKLVSSNCICQDILVPILNGASGSPGVSIPLDLKGQAILRDALFSMTCKEMRHENLRKAGSNEEDSQTGENVTPGSTKTFLSNKILMKNFISSVVPTIVKLKHHFLQENSPFVRDLRTCLLELMNNYRHEVDDFLLEDPKLAAEVTDDIKHAGSEDSTRSTDTVDAKLVAPECSTSQPVQASRSSPGRISKKMETSCKSSPAEKTSLTSLTDAKQNSPGCSTSRSPQPSGSMTRKCSQAKIKSSTPSSPVSKSSETGLDDIDLYAPGCSTSQSPQPSGSMTRKCSQAKSKSSTSSSPVRKSSVTGLGDIDLYAPGCSTSQSPQPSGLMDQKSSWAKSKSSTSPSPAGLDDIDLYAPGCSTSQSPQPSGSMTRKCSQAKSKSSTPSSPVGKSSVTGLDDIDLYAPGCSTSQSPQPSGSMDRKFSRAKSKSSVSSSPAGKSPVSDSADAELLVPETSVSYSAEDSNTIPGRTKVKKRKLDTPSTGKTSETGFASHVSNLMPNGKSLRKRKSNRMSSTADSAKIRFI